MIGAVIGVQCVIFNCFYTDFDKQLAHVKNRDKSRCMSEFTADAKIHANS